MPRAKSEGSFRRLHGYIREARRREPRRERLRLDYHHRRFDQEGETCKVQEQLLRNAGIIRG